MCATDEAAIRDASCGELHRSSKSPSRKAVYEGVLRHRVAAENASSSIRGSADLTARELRFLEQ